MLNVHSVSSPAWLPTRMSVYVCTFARLVPDVCVVCSYVCLACARLRVRAFVAVSVRVCVCVCFPVCACVIYDKTYQFGGYAHLIIVAKKFWYILDTISHKIQFFEKNYCSSLDQILP